MTREEAKEILTHNWTRVDNPNYSESELDEAFFMAIEALSAEADWIPCSERLPEEPFGCLVTVEDSIFDGSGFCDFNNILPYHVGYAGGTWNDGLGVAIPFEVIAWMPLPKPYREDGEV